MAGASDRLAGPGPQHGKGKIRQRQRQPPDGVPHRHPRLVLPQQPLQHRQPRRNKVYADIPEGKAPLQPALIVPPVGGRQQHKGVDQVRHIDAQRHTQRHARGTEPPERAAMGVMPAGAQRQLIEQYQQIAQVCVVHEKTGADTVLLRQPRLFVQSDGGDQHDHQRRQPQHSHPSRSAFSRAISRA